MRHRFLSLACVAAFSVAGAVHAETALELLDHTQKDLQTRYDAKKTEDAKKAEEARKAKAAKIAEVVKKVEETKDSDEAKKELAAKRLEIEEEFNGFMPFNQRDMGLQNGLSTLAQAREYLESGNDNNAIQQLGALRSSSDLPEDIKSATDAVRQKLLEERTAREATFAAEVEAACQRAGDAVSKAKEPRDLDGTLQDLAKLARKPVYNRYRESGGENQTASQLQAATSFVNRWQDYLQARARNDDRAVTNALRYLTDNSNQPLLIPRSVILALQPAKDPDNDNPRSTPRPVQRPTEQIDADAAKVIEGVKTLDDVPDALGKLAKLRQEITSRASYSLSGDSVLSSATTGLQNVQRAHLEIRQGLAATISLGSGRSESNAHPSLENALLPLRVQLVKLAAPRLLGAPETDKAADGEGLDAYLRRLIESAKKRQDWSAVERGLDLKRTLAATASNDFASANDQESRAFKDFFAGRNLEQAHQYEQAVISYLTALRSGQEDLPAALIGEHLDAIQKAHPAEYASGSKYILDPPRPSYPFGPPPGMYRHMMNEPRFPGQPTPTATPGDSLSVPAATVTPKSSATPAAPAATVTPTP